MITRPCAGRLAVVLCLLAVWPAGAQMTGTEGRSPRPGSLPKSAGDPKQWQQEAVWYQIFPERFRNGDPSNDPIRTSLEGVARVPEDWAVTPWGADWYSRSAWEREAGPDFYWPGVFQRRYGGDLQGIIDKLDYLKELGVNALYLNPVFQGRSMHKYDGSTFHHIDPYFGPDPAGDLAMIAGETENPATWQWTSADRLFLRLLGEAHARGLRVIIDGVFNHTGRDFFAFRDVLAKGQESRYRDWYAVEAWDNPETPENEFRYRGWYGHMSLPEFKDVTERGTETLHPHVRQYIFDITRRWMDPDGNGDPSDGVDGWRLDVANLVPVGFWRDWNTLVHTLNPAAYTVTEIWVNPVDFVLQGGFDATMNYHGFAMPVKGFLYDNAITASRFAEILESKREEWPPLFAGRLQNLLDSHDTPRAVSSAHNGNPEAKYKKPDEFDIAEMPETHARGNPAYRWEKPGADAWKILRMAAVLQMTWVGAPMIYYGTEAGLWGGNDPDNRKPMLWEDLAYEPESTGPQGEKREPVEVKFDRDLWQFYREAIALRRGDEVFRSGEVVLIGTNDKAKTWVFARRQGDRWALVALNRSRERQTLTFPAPAGLPEAAWRTVLVSDASSASATVADGQVKVEIAPLAAGVFRP